MSYLVELGPRSQKKTGSLEPPPGTMEKLQLFLSEGEEILYDSALDLESLLDLLSEIVIEEREKLEAEKDSIQKLKVDLESAQDLDPVLIDEQRTQETIEAVSSLLEYIMNDSNKDTSTLHDLDQPHPLKSNVASVEEQENQLSDEEQHLHKPLEAAQTALTKLREQPTVANEEFCALHEQCSSECSVVYPGKTKTDGRVDACLEQLAKLRHLAKKM